MRSRRPWKLYTWWSSAKTIKSYSTLDAAMKAFMRLPASEQNNSDVWLEKEGQPRRYVVEYGKFGEGGSDA